MEDLAGDVVTSWGSLLHLRYRSAGVGDHVIIRLNFDVDRAILCRGKFDDWTSLTIRMNVEDGV